MAHDQHPVEKKGKNEGEIAQEMMPFIIYAAIPLVITITLALVFGPPY